MIRNSMEKRNSTVLVVDDDEIKRYSITRILSSAGFEIDEAETGMAAIERAFAKQPDVIVLDVKLPDMSGFEVCRRLREDPRTRSAAILHLSSTYMNSEHRVEGLDRGADGYLTQDVSPEELIATVRSLKRMRLAEEEARRLAEEWQTTFDAISEGICLLSSEGTVLRYNKRIRKIFGAKNESLLGKQWSDIIPANVWEENSDPVALMWSRREETGGEFLLHENWYQITVQPILSDKKSTGAVIVIADIAERKRVEEATRELSQRKDEFLANMSHEIRTPMNAVIGLSYVLANMDPLTKRQKECVGTLQTSAESLMALINDLLDVARLENEGLKLEHTPFSLEEILQETISIMGVRAREKNLTLTFDYDKALQRQFLGDPLRIKQILFNLIANAIKFTSQGGVKIVLKGAKTNVSEKFLISLDIADTGIGIPPDKLGSIFSKFSQADTSTTRKYGGSGLGLAITTALIEIMGGTINVESAIGKGSTFSVQFELEALNQESALDYTHAHKAAEAIRQSSIKPFGEDAPTVLLVEDFEGNVFVATTLLDLLNVRCEVATNGREALQKLSARDFDLILMDVQMPEMDGFTLTRLIREREKQEGRRTPIIGVTALALLGDKERCLNAGMDDYMAKPFDAHNLAEKIKFWSKKKEASISDVHKTAI